MTVHLHGIKWNDRVSCDPLSYSGGIELLHIVLALPFCGFIHVFGIHFFKETTECDISHVCGIKGVFMFLDAQFQTLL